MYTSKHHLDMRMFGTLVVAVIMMTYIAGCVPVPAPQSEATDTVATLTESAVSQPSPLIDAALREAINDLPNKQAGSNILVLKEGLPPADSQLLTTEIDGLKEMTATVLAINELVRKQSSVSFTIPGQSAADGEGLGGTIEWNSAGSFDFDAMLALDMPKVTVPTEAGEPLIIDWQRATALGAVPGQPGDELKNAILKLYPPPETTWKACPDDAACEDVPVGCKYPIRIPGRGYYCPFGNEAPLGWQPKPLIDAALREAINNLASKQTGSNILVLKKGLPPAGNQLLTSEIDGLKEMTATVLAINDLVSKQSSASFTVPGQSAADGEALTGELEWDSAGSFDFDAPLALDMPRVTVPTQAGDPLIIDWQRATVLGVEPGQSDEELKNVIMKLYPPPETTWKACPECSGGDVPVWCSKPIYILGLGYFCPLG